LIPRVKKKQIITYFERQRLLRSACYASVDDVIETREENGVLLGNATTTERRIGYAGN